MCRVFQYAGILALLFVLIGCAYYHVIEEGDTLYDLSREYGVSVQDIQRANPGVDPYNLQVGQRVKVPRFPDQVLSDYGDQQQTPRPRTTPTPYISRTPRQRTPAPRATPPPTQERMRFLWPVNGGTIVRRFGDRNEGIVSLGLDIELPLGTPIRATEAGTVILASDRFKGYGLMVIIKHPNNFVTIYAHNRKNLVRENDKVTRGQLVAEVGQTGRVDRPTLHFQMRIGHEAVDPFRYLPAR